MIPPDDRIRVYKEERAKNDPVLLHAEIDRLRAELAAAETWHMQYVDEANAEYNALADAIARVRELCDGPLERGCICVSCVILRALEPSDGGSE